MNLLQAAQQVLINRTIDIYIDMRCETDQDEEKGYRAHFGDMGEMIYRIDTYRSFSSICEAVETGMFTQIGLTEDADDLETFIDGVKKYMSKF